MTDIYPPIDPPNIGSVAKHSLTFDEVEERLIEAMDLWHRSPGEGRWPFASDGPWHLVVPDASDAGRAEHILNAEREGKAAAETPRRLPLLLAEVERRDRTSEWIGHAPERDRRLVTLVLAHKARSDRPVKWSRIRQQLIKAGEASISARGLGMRYSRAITAIAKSLNSLKSGADGVSMPMRHRRENKGCSPLASE